MFENAVLELNEDRIERGEICHRFCPLALAIDEQIEGAHAVVTAAKTYVFSNGWDADQAAERLSDDDERFAEAMCEMSLGHSANLSKWLWDFDHMKEKQSNPRIAPYSYKDDPTACEVIAVPDGEGHELTIKGLPRVEDLDNAIQ